MEGPIINKVSESGLVTLDLEEFYPKEEIVTFDMKDFLFMGLILKEKEFRAALPTHQWGQYKGKNVAVTCTADAIIPVWAYMLVNTYLQPVANYVFLGTAEELKKHTFIKKIEALDEKEYTDKRVVIKGCGEIKIDDYAYLAITGKLLPVVKSIMYGEPCSTVPVYKKK
jgi:hypothetical protein